MNHRFASAFGGALGVSGRLPGVGVRPFVVSPPDNRWRPSRSVAPVAHPPRKTVLVLDDEPCVRLLYRAVLHRTGLRVVATGDSFEALRLIARCRPDVLVCDLMRPNLCGDDFIIRVRRRHPLLPVLVFSGTAVPEVCARIRALGARSCLPKPFGLHTLVQALRRALDARIRVPPSDAAGGERPTCQSDHFHRFHRH